MAPEAHVRLEDELMRAKSLLAAEKQALEMIANGAPLPDILNDLCRMIDAQATNAITSIQLMDPDGEHLWPTAGPKVPNEWSQMIAPLKIGPSVGSCGTAAFLKKRVITTDVAGDPSWAGYEDAALRCGIRAAWSQPIISKNQQVLGTFAMYFAEPRSPSDSDLQLIEAAGRIALIAIERKRAEEAARAAQVRFEGILEIAQDGIVSVDSRQRIVLFNQGAEKIFGYAQAEVMGRSLELLLPQRFAAAHAKHVIDFAGSSDVARMMGQRREVSGRRKDGSEFPAEASISKLNLEGELVFTVILRDITERKRAEQRLVAQHTVTHVLAAASTLEEATPKILQAVCECLAWDLGELWRIDRVANVLRCVEVWYKPTVKAPRFVATSSDLTFRPGIGLPGRVWSNRQPAYIADVVQDSNFPRATIAAQEGLHAAFAFPILLGNEVVGVMDFFSRESRQPDQDLLEMMATIGSQIGQFIERKHAEEALRASMQNLKGKQDLLDLAQRAARAMAFDWYIQQPVNKWSPEQEALYGMAPGTFDGRFETWKNLIHPEDWPRVVESLRRSHETGEIDAEYRVIWPNGSIHWHAATGQMFMDPQGRPFRMVGFTADVTRRKLVELELRRSEAYLAEGQKLSRTGSFGWNLATGEIFWSAETYRIFGHDPATKPTLEMMISRTHPADHAYVTQVIEQAQRQRSGFSCEHRLLMRDGSVKHLQIEARDFQTGPANQVELIGAVMDVTERTLANERLRQDELELRKITDIIPQVIAVLALDGTVLYANQLLMQYSGLSPERLHGYELRERLFHPDDLERVHEARTSALQKGAPFELEMRARRHDGVYRWFFLRYNPLLDENGKVLRWYASGTDIEDRKQAEVQLQRSEAYLSEAQKLTHTGSYAWSVATGQLTYWSDEVYRLWGFDPQAGMPTFEEFRERIHPEDRAAADEVLARSIREGTDNDILFRIQLPNGTTRYIQSVGHPVMNVDGQVIEIFGTNMDVTETIQAQRALEKAYNEIQALKDQLQKENIALREELDKSAMFEEIVGSSESLRAVLAQVTRVAPTDSTVLILGETGTGKELMARAIHKRSNRAARAFIRVNCAAIPQSLIASELFGHEKGSFTGALQRRIGRFESANGGTIFLDEVGELPPETQVALLRVLQEREIERVGSSQPMRVDVRVLAGTNRDISASVAAGAFRQDLFYRLNVFPITVPPLRDRVEDIPLLVEYLLERYGQKAGKKFRTVNRKTLDLFQRYSWPGNVRELQNVIERAVVLCDEATFSVDESWLKSEKPQKSTAIPLAVTLADREKEMIERALSESGGRIAGPTGAAAKLGMPRQTLESKIKGLGIDKYKYKAQLAQRT